MTKVRDFIIGFLFIGGLLLILAIGGYSDTHYSTTAEVFLIEGDEVTLIDGAGDLWRITGRPDLRKGQFVKIKFENGGTDYTRRDDIILSVKALDN